MVSETDLRKFKKKKKRKEKRSDIFFIRERSILSAWSGFIVHLGLDPSKFQGSKHHLHRGKQNPLQPRTSVIRVLESLTPKKP